MAVTNAVAFTADGSRKFVPIHMNEVYAFDRDLRDADHPNVGELQQRASLLLIRRFRTYGLQRNYYGS